MGNNCSREVYENEELFIGPYISPSKEQDKLQDTQPNEQKSTEHTVTKIVKKHSVGPIFSTKGDCDANIEIPQDDVVIVEQKGLGVPKAPSGPKESMLRFPTNFKIEPVHFRKECTKESFMSRYSAEEIIGSGSFGIVKKIQDQETGLYRAVKIISKNNCQRTDNFADEIEIIKKLVN